MGYYVNIHPDNPQHKQMVNAVKVIADGGIAIIPTDTVYAMACDHANSRAIERMAKIKGQQASKTKFSFVFEDLSQISTYTKQFETATYKLLKRALPGPYTFIMEASNALNKAFKNKKKTVGIRMPENNIPRELVSLLGRPLAVTSFHIDDAILEYPTDATLIYDEFKDLVDVVIDGGNGSLTPSTIIDLTGHEPVVLREGLGSLDILG